MPTEIAGAVQESIRREFEGLRYLMAHPPRSGRSEDRQITMRDFYIAFGALTAGWTAAWAVRSLLL